VPAALKVTVVPETEQTSEPEETSMETVTGSAEEAE